MRVLLADGSGGHEASIGCPTMNVPRSRKRLKEADRGEFATDEEVAAIFNRYRGG